MKRFSVLLLVAVFCATTVLSQTKRTLVSPNEKIKIEVELADGITYDVFCDGEQILDNCRMSLDVAGNVLGSQPQLKGTQHRSVNEIKRPFLHLKYAEVPNIYNEMLLKMKGNYSVEFRAYDDGIAYRFVTNLGKTIEVNDEDITLFFPQEANLVLQQSDRFRTSYEERYSFVKSSEWHSYQKMAHYPILAITAGGTKILMSESDLRDYPAPFFRSNDANGFSSVFPKVPSKEKPRSDKSNDVLM
ncbi:MAG: glycoside hydrolase family 97 N-terminal domain-containing protein, partial [Bacteroidaceae bacterium]|nr:glycoside hydrolase family 97 N-terminal domain-containing protein [Bacteroidaceae bacterium]